MQSDEIYDTFLEYLNSKNIVLSKNALYLRLRRTMCNVESSHEDMEIAECMPIHLSMENVLKCFNLEEYTMRPGFTNVIYSELNNLTKSKCVWQMKRHFF